MHAHASYIPWMMVVFAYIFTNDRTKCIIRAHNRLQQTIMCIVIRSSVSSVCGVVAHTIAHTSHLIRSCSQESSHLGTHLPTRRNAPTHHKPPPPPLLFIALCKFRNRTCERGKIYLQHKHISFNKATTRKHEPHITKISLYKIERKIVEKCVRL